ncbi:MAG: hypothetical protein LBL61_02395, partial [Elusimicrobiota bacterium]|nr:hypothetical protein [Elusimicrobiota bacterium]
MPVKELIKKLKFKRNWLINAAAGGLVAFLALPAFFDTEEPAPLTARAHYEGLDAKGVPLSFTPDEEGEEAALPIVAAQKARRKAQSGNAFFKYMDKVGNFYRKGFEVAVGINPAGRAPEEDFYMEARADYERSAPLAPAEYNSNVQQNLKAAASGVRQQPAGLTPVRGLYEVSLTDGDKYEAKQVYKGVIGKVNRATPGLAPQKPARKYAIMQETFVLAGNNMAGAGIYAAPFGGLSGFGANIGGSSSQSGIAGAADTASGSAFGRYGGFGGVSSRVPDAPQEDESMQANFETAAAGFERRVRAIASKGGSSGDKPDSAAAAVRDSIRQNVASSQGGGTDGGAGNNQPSQP